MNDSIFDKLTNKIKSLPMEAIVERAADRQDDLMVDLNIEQLSAGIKSTGARIVPPYRPRTIIIKTKKGQPTDRVTLQDTKDFVHGIRVKNFPRKKELISQDSKSEMLQEKYKPEIFGLTDTNLGKVRAKMLPLMQRDVKNLLKNFRQQ